MVVIMSNHQRFYQNQNFKITCISDTMAFFGFINFTKTYRFQLFYYLSICIYLSSYNLSSISINLDILFLSNPPLFLFHPSVCLSFYLFICSTIYFYLSIYLSIYLFNCVYIWAFHLEVNPSMGKGKWILNSVCLQVRPESVFLDEG